jgi:hypothetical protein
LAIALEEWMGQHADEAVAIAGRAAVEAGLAFAGDADAHFVVDAGRDLDFGGDFFEDLAAAATGGAGVLDDRAFAVALRAGGLDADDAGGLDDAALAAAVAADFAAAAIGGAGAATFFAAVVPLEFDGLRDAVGGFFECERDIAADVATLLRAIAISAAAAGTAEEVAEQIAERREDIFDVVEMMRAVTTVEACVAEAIVA